MRLVGKKKTLPTLHKSLSCARVQYSCIYSVTRRQKQDEKRGSIYLENSVHWG
jgi:hypothetical protein